MSENEIDNTPEETPEQSEGDGNVESGAEQQAPAVDGDAVAATGMKKPITRRTVVAAAGGVVVGLIAGGFLANWGVTSAAVASGRVSIMTTPTKLIVTDRARCSGCQRCEMACSIKNDGHVSQLTARVKIWRNYLYGKGGVGSGGGLYGNMEWVMDTCKQCADPWCAKTCPANAIIADPTTGARIVDTDVCIGCGMCRAACPWNMPTVDTAIAKSTKCIACGRCAAQCPNGAIVFVDWQDIAQQVLDTSAVSTLDLISQA